MNILCIPYVTNIFFRKLCEGLGRCGCSVSFESEKLWENPFKFEILHVHFPEGFYEWGNEKSSFTADRAAKRFIERLSELKNCGVKIIWTVHNLRSHDSLYPDLDNEVYQAVIEYSDGIILQCEMAEGLLKKAYPKSIARAMEVIPHPNYIDCYSNEISRKEARKLLKLDPKDFIYLCFGQIRPYKNFSLLLEAFNKVLKVKKNSGLVIAGNPHKKFKKIYLWFLKIYAFFQPKIIFKTGFIPDTDIQMYMNAADVCVFSYKDIFMSGAVILAESFGLPVIAPDIGCLPDYVKEEWGFLYKEGDARALAEKMLEAAYRNLAGMEKKAFAFQRQNDYVTIAKRTSEFYKKVLNFN